MESASDSVSELALEAPSDMESRAIPEPGVGPNSMEDWVEGWRVEGGRAEEAREVWDVERRTTSSSPSATCQTMM